MNEQEYSPTIAPGRELDAIVSNAVFGKYPLYAHYKNMPSGTVSIIPLVDGEPIPAYSTNLVAAWAVVEKMTKDAYDVFISGVSPHQSGWGAIFDYGDFGKFSARGETVPHAICLAALKAMNTKDEPTK